MSLTHKTQNAWERSRPRQEPRNGGVINRANMARECRNATLDHPLRVLVTDARVQALLVRWLPDRPREAIIRRFAGP